MPIHDWTRVDPGIFHSFHNTWQTPILIALNGGLLPKGYYALTEQHAGKNISDLLALCTGGPPTPQSPIPPSSGGLLVADAPPRVQRRQTIDGSLVSRRRSIALRHVSGHRLIALIEIISPANKDRATHVAAFVNKVVEALNAGVHVLVIDLFPPGRHDPKGIHGAIHEQLEDFAEPSAVPTDRPLTIVSYAAGPRIEVYLHHAKVGETIPDQPLFFESDRYVNVPLESAYQFAFSGTPDYWREILEAA